MIDIDRKEDLNQNNKLVLPWQENPFKLWSLMELLRVHAEAFIALGELFWENRFNLFASSVVPEFPITAKEQEKLKRFLSIARGYCLKLNLPVSEALLSKAIDDLPQGHRELNILIDAVRQELKLQLFLFIPSYRTDYYEWQLAEIITTSFPDASKELIRAGKCYSKGEDTACVFHSMRAAEIGLRTLAKHLNVTFKFEINLSEWNALIIEIGEKIESLLQLPKSEARDEERKFCSEAASQFRYFNNAYRIFVAHARENYEEDQAKKIMDHTREFLESLSTKLKEV